MSLIEEKREARKRMKEILGAISPKDAEKLSFQAAENFRSLPGYAEADILLAFLSKAWEIRTERLIAEARAEGKIVAVPRMEHSPEQGHYIVFIPLPDDYQIWPRDRFDIPEPPADTLALSDGEIFSTSVIIATPGLAFDRRGRRLGRGRGYYDRFLARARANIGRLRGSVIACGLCYGFQLIDEVPCDENDSAVDLVVTEKGILYPEYHELT
jgi:5-formyltetrahydrofolate cyclo-ligase